MSAANPTTAALTPVVPRERAAVAGLHEAPPRARAGTHRGLRDPGAARAAWLVPVLWAVLTSFKTEAEAAAMPVTIVPEDGFTLRPTSTCSPRGSCRAGPGTA